MTTKVRTTIEPAKVLEVGESELVDLHRQSLLHSFERSEVTDRHGLGKSPNRWRDGTAEVVESGTLDAPEVDESTDNDKGQSA